MRYLIAVAAMALLGDGSKSTADVVSAQAQVNIAAAPTTGQLSLHRRPGLWLQRLSMDGQPRGSVRICIDAASDAALFAYDLDMHDARCTPIQFTRAPNGAVSFTRQCDMGWNETEQWFGVIKGDLRSRYTVVTHYVWPGSRYDPAGNHVVTHTETWAGPCPKGVVGGDELGWVGKRNILADDIFSSKHLAPGPTEAEYPPLKDYSVPGSNLIVHFESDHRMIIVSDQSGHQLYREDPFAAAEMHPYRLSKPLIVNVFALSATEAAEAECARPGVPVISIGYNSSQYGCLNVLSGRFVFLGQN